MLTNDYDISNLARTVYHLFTNGLDHGYAQSAVEILSENPVRICGYLGEDNITRISFPSDEKPHLFSEGFIKFQKEAKDDIEAIIRLAYGVKL